MAAKLCKEQEISFGNKTKYWKQRTAVKVVENALQYIKMYVAGVWTKTAKGYYKNVEEEVIRLQTKQGLKQFIVLLKLKSTF